MIDHPTLYVYVICDLKSYLTTSNRKRGGRDKAVPMGGGGW
jgi:hypothetical protein